MTNVDLYNSDGSTAGTVELPDALFGRKWNSDLVHQALVAFDSNARRVIAHAKGRGEVAGGGRKPWRQKGTGRARHGSIRSPLWKGGGVTHGPTKERNFEKKLNKKMRRLALFAVLSKKAADKEIRVVRSFDISEPKTRNAERLLKALFGKNTSRALLVPAAADKNVQTVCRAARNLKNAEGLAPEALNVRDVLRNKYLVIEQPALSTMEKTFNKK